MYGGGLCPPYLGTPKHNAVVLLIYIRLFCLQKIAVIAAILLILASCTVFVIAAILPKLYILYLQKILFVLHSCSVGCYELV